MHSTLTRVEQFTTYESHLERSAMHDILYCVKRRGACTIPGSYSSVTRSVSRVVVAVALSRLQHAEKCDTSEAMLSEQSPGT